MSKLLVEGVSVLLGMCGIDFLISSVSVRFLKNLGFGSEWVGSFRFEKTWFGLDITVIYYLCIGWV